MIWVNINVEIISTYFDEMQPTSQKSCSLTPERSSTVYLYLSSTEIKIVQSRPYLLITKTNIDVDYTVF